VKNLFISEGFMSKSEFLDWLNNEVYQKVMRSLDKMPKKASEIAEETGLPLDKVIEIIKYLEAKKAVICDGTFCEVTDFVNVFKNYLRLFKEYFE
jgi:predicted transcriptional regulator